MEVIHDKTKQQFTLIDKEEQIGEINYREDKRKIDVYHTGILLEYRGKDLGFLLLDALREYQLEVQKEIVPTCPYILKNMDMFRKLVA